MSRPITIIEACLLLLVILVSLAVGKTFEKCELAQELRKQGFPEDQLSIWLCTIDAESSFRTYVVGGPDRDGSYDYGLFQINDRYWCNNGNTPGKGCNTRCSDLLSDDITIAAQCAQKIYNQQGFSAWVGWNKCRGEIERLDC